MDQPQNVGVSRLLVTGKSGFVGNHFCSRFGGAALMDERGNVDLRDAARVKSAIAQMRPEAVLHLAAQSSVAASFKDPLATLSTNFHGTFNLLQGLNAIQFRGCFVYVSSAEVYGSADESDLPLTEERPLRPRSPYAVSKVAAEALCYQWSQTGDFRVLVARPFNQIGIGQNRRFAIPYFARQIVEIRNGRIPARLRTGNLDVTRDFTDILDTIDAYHLLLEKGRTGQVYNVCSGRERSLRSLVEVMLRIAGVRVEFEIDESRLRSGEQARMVGDPSKIREEIGWKANSDLAITLANILNEAETY